MILINWLPTYNLSYLDIAQVTESASVSNLKRILSPFFLGINLFCCFCDTKGQLKSEWIYEVIDFPNYHLKYLKDFCLENFEVEYLFLDIGKFDQIFCIFKLGLPCVLKVISTKLLFNLTSNKLLGQKSFKYLRWQFGKSMTS